MTTTEFDQIFEGMSAPEYPATCDECGEVGTNASMEEHICQPQGLGWKYRKGYPDYCVYDYYNNLIASGIKTEETAKGIVDYVNNHAQLVAALRGLMTRFEQTGEAWMSDPAWIAANEALSRVRG